MRASTLWWLGTVVVALVGLGSIVVGAYVEVQRAQDVGLYWLVGGTGLFVFAGIAATAATKYQQREEKTGVVLQSERERGSIKNVRGAR